MAGDWRILGGDPAPGSLASLDTVMRDFGRVAERSAEAAGTLRRIGADVGVQRWTGTAAAAFKDNLGKAPGNLDKAAGSYAAAVRALRAYHDFLTHAQQRANSLRSLANQAAADEAEAVRKLADAKSRLASLEGQRRTAAARSTQLKLQIAATTDSTAKTQLQAVLSRVQATIRRLDADVNAAKADAARHQNACDDARRRLESARRQAVKLGEEARRAADTAARQLQEAEKQAQLPNAAERAWTETREFVAEYGPVLVGTLQLGSTLFSIAAAVFPVGAPIFLAGSLICGGMSLLLDVGVTANTPGGFTTEKLWDLGSRALGVAATAVGFGAMKAAATGGASISTWARTDKVLDVVRGGVELFEGYATGGASGLVGAAGALVLTKGTTYVGGYVGGKVLQAGVGGLNHVPVVKDGIKALSVDVRQSPGPFGMTVPVSTVREQQALLAGSHIPPGGFTYGNSGSSLADHRLAQKETTELFKEATKDSLDDAVDQLGVDDLIASFLVASEPTPEIDINLPQK